MEIILNNVMPIPLSSINHGLESIWGNLVELKSGKHILLNASSGKGKSTFTSLMLGLRSDFSGTILFDGNDTKQFKLSDWTAIRQNKISAVFQDLQLFSDLTVAENLLIKNNLTQLFSEKEILEMLEKLEIENKWQQKCGLLSMGQQQRVAIVRSLLQPFEWLMMDEPFSHLDEENTQKCLNLITQRCHTLSAGFVLTSLGSYHGFEYEQELKL